MPKKRVLVIDAYNVIRELRRLGVSFENLERWGRV